MGFIHKSPPSISSCIPLKTKRIHQKLVYPFLDLFLQWQHPSYLPIDDRVLGHANHCSQLLDLHPGIHPDLPQPLAEGSPLGRIIIIENLFWNWYRKFVSSINNTIW